jgi:cytochrome c biogenesis protein CcdA
VGLIAEAATSILLPCSLAIVVPAVLLAVATAGRWPPVGAASIGLALGAWEHVGPWPGLAAAVAGTVGLAAWAALLAARSRPAPAALAAAVAGASAATVWIPCVGSHLGDALGTAARDPLAGLVPVAAYVLVLTLPGVAVARVTRWWASRGGRRQRIAVVSAGVLGLGYSVLVITGAATQVAGTLARWSG